MLQARLDAIRLVTKLPEPTEESLANTTPCSRRNGDASVSQAMGCSSLGAHAGVSVLLFDLVSHTS